MLLILASHVSPTTADPSPNQFSCSTNIWRQLPHSVCSNDIFGPPCWRLAVTFMHHFCVIGLIQCKLEDCCISVSLFLLLDHQAKEDEKQGNIAAARAKANISLGLNIAAVVFVVVVWSVVAIPVAVTVSAQTSATTVTPVTSPYCYSAASSLYYCYQSSCYLYFHGLNYYSCYDSSSYSYSAASNYYSNGYYSTYYQCDSSYQLTCVQV